MCLANNLRRYSCVKEEVAAASCQKYWTTPFGTTPTPLINCVIEMRDEQWHDLKEHGGCTNLFALIP